MTYISLLNNTTNLVELLENINLSTQELVERIFENEVTMNDIDKANKIIIKKHGKENIKFYKLPVIENCEYACTAHSQCVCLYKYARLL